MLLSLSPILYAMLGYARLYISRSLLILLPHKPVHDYRTSVRAGITIKKCNSKLEPSDLEFNNYSNGNHMSRSSRRCKCRMKTNDLNAKTTRNERKEIASGGIGGTTDIYY